MEMIEKLPQNIETRKNFYLQRVNQFPVLPKSAYLTLDSIVNILLANP